VPKSLVRNTLTSVFTTALDFGVLTGLVELFHVNYVFATFCGTVVGALSNFFINRHWSFEATGARVHGQLARFVPVQAGSSGLQTLGVWLFTDKAHVQYMASKLIVAVLVYLMWNYPMNRWVVFRTKAA
jgi:putative flippase GtrA